MPRDNKVVVLAIGGNSLVRDKAHQTVPDQFEVTRETCQHIARLIQAGWRVVVTHGNGPQVGFILRRAELSYPTLHMVPLDSCGADTQGSIGYMIQQALYNEFKKQNIEGQVTTVVTQVLVDHNDPAFKNPSKPIGSFMEQEMAEKRAKEDGITVVEDAGRGWRQVVASPYPVKIVEKEAVSSLLEANFTVVAVGGGGIPVIEDEQGELKGVDAVIDKDFASALLATELQAEILFISTAVEKVYLHFGKPEEKALDRITVSQAKTYLKEGHFAPGSMAPKVKAILTFIEEGGKAGIITHPAHIEEAIEEKAGTWIVPD